MEQLKELPALTAAGLAGIAALRISEAMDRGQMAIVWERLTTGSRRLLLSCSALHYTIAENEWEYLARHEKKQVETTLREILTFLASAGVDHAQARMTA